MHLMDRERRFAVRESMRDLGWLPSDLNCEEKRRLAEEDPLVNGRSHGWRSWWRSKQQRIQGGRSTKITGGLRGEARPAREPQANPPINHACHIAVSGACSA